MSDDRPRTWFRHSHRSTRHHRPIQSEDYIQISLSELAVGEQGSLVTSHGGRLFANRLASLGFTPGVQVIMEQNYGHGPLLVTVRGTRVALGRGEAAKIIVERGR